MQHLRSRAQFPAELASMEVNALGRWADDPTELPPFGLNFTAELPPSKMERFFNAPPANEDRLILTCSDKR